LKVLMAGPVAPVRGPIPKLMPLLADGLRAAGCAVTVCQWGRHRDDESAFDKLRDRVRDLQAIRVELRRDAYDVLLVKTAHDWAALTRDLPLLRAVRGLARATVVALHGTWADRLVEPGSRVLKVVSAGLPRWSDAVLVLSRQEQEQWARFAPRGRIRLMKDPYVTPPAAPATAGRREFGVPADVPLVLFVGRLIAAKGIFELIDAMSAVNAERPCHLLILGQGEEREALARRARGLGISDRITFAGYVGQDLLQAAYRCADVFVLPSWAEGFPVAILEAMDGGLPIVTTPIRGMADHLVEGRSGLFVPVRDPQSLASTMLKLLRDPELRRRLGAGARAKVPDFAPSEVAQEHLAVFREVLEARTMVAPGRKTSGPGSGGIDKGGNCS
jgi:glycosyltransferase involved in cell wall biosynthesis